MKLFATTLLSSLLCLSFSAAYGETLSTIQMIGSNSPNGSSYDEAIEEDGGAQLIAGGSLEVTPRTADLNAEEFIFEVSYQSTSGGFVEDTSSNWFANYRLGFERPTSASRYYFWYEGENGPLDLSFNGWGGSIIEHPFDPSIPEVASFGINRDLGLSHHLGIFSNPFSGIANELGVDASEVTGFGLATRLSSPVPEPGSSTILVALGIMGLLIRKKL